MAKRITGTIGVDLGDRYSTWCEIDQETGEELESGRVRTTPAALERFFGGRPRARVVMETGTHSPWVSRIAAEACEEALVANARELRFIFRGKRKSDTVDAMVLARVGRLDPNLLSPIRHRGEVAQRDLMSIRARDALVSARTKLVNAVRGLMKSSGFRLRKQAAKSVGHRSLQEVPEELRETLRPLLHAIEALADEIKEYDAQVESIAKERYPETERLTQVTGVGRLTALAYVLTLEDPAHFATSRHAGAFLGLVPRRDQSGETDKQLRISRCGDRMVRTLLVQCAHYILGRNGPDTDLKRFGERRASRGGASAKKRAVIAVARKLAVLLHALWRTGESYQPNRHNRAA
jgi:transposase